MVLSERWGKLSVGRWRRAGGGVATIVCPVSFPHG